MKLLLTITDADISEAATSKDADNYSHREATRAVVLTPDGKVPLLNVRKHGYYKLPGGGIDRGEDIETALKREMLEEIGCEIDSIQPLGLIDEVHDQENLTQRSHCYIASISKKVSEPDFTKDEIADNFSVVWANDLNEAVRLLTECNTDNYVGKYIVKRDLLLLNKAREICNESL